MVSVKSIKKHVIIDFFVLEPVIHEGLTNIEVLSDGWTIVTTDGKRYYTVQLHYGYDIAICFWSIQTIFLQTFCSNIFPFLPRAAQFEETILITSDGIEVLTQDPKS